MIQPTIPDSELYSWESQVCQFPKVGKPGLSYCEFCVCGRRACSAGTESCGRMPVDTFLFRNNKGHLVGVLYHYATDSDYEKRGNVNIWIRPDRQRRGIGTKLVEYAIRKLGPINFDQQRYTAAGAAFAEKFRKRLDEAG